MAAAPEGDATRLLTASPVFGRLIQRIQALGGGRHKWKKWAATAGNRVVRTLLDLLTSLFLLRDTMAAVEQTMGIDLAPRLSEIRAAAYRIENVLYEIELYRFRAGLAKGQPPITSFFLGRSKHGNSFKTEQSRLMDQFAAAVAESEHLIAPMGKGSKNPWEPNPCIPQLDPRELIAADQQQQQVLGREVEQDKIVQSLIQSSSCRLSVIPVVGDCGVGKTTLAQLVYSDTRVEQHFDLQIWVVASSASGKMEVMREILQSADPGFADKIAKADFPMLLSELSCLVALRRFLLVLDEVWDGEKPEQVHKQN